MIQVQEGNNIYFPVRSSQVPELTLTPPYIGAAVGRGKG